MGLILSIETSTKKCSVALHDNGVLLSHAEINEEKSHSREIILLIDRLFADNGKSLNSTDAFAVSMGPGSYTGLRIGVSTAKGFCFSLDKPLIAINTLEAMALGVNKINPDGNVICPMIDARRMEVYTALFDAANTTLEKTSAMILDENSFSTYLQKHKIIFCGDGSEKFKKILPEGGNVVYRDNVSPSAIYIGELASDAFAKKKFEDVAYFEPFYLKDFVSTGKKPE